MWQSQPWFDNCRPMVWGLMVFGCLIGHSNCASAEEVFVEQNLYAKADANRDKKITLKEFLLLPGDKAVLRRDFQICFKGIRNDNKKAELVSVSVGASVPDLKIHYAGDRSFSSNINWSPDGSRMIVGMVGGTPPRMLVHEFNSITGNEPTLLKGLEGEALSMSPYGGCWSPNGTFLILTTQPN